jgi:hypothetical protein
MVQLNFVQNPTEIINRYNVCGRNARLYEDYTFCFSDNNNNNYYSI